jgi:tetratricopeptide (TPR) repeat protein
MLGDFHEAARIISEPGFPKILPRSDVSDDPTELARAMVAFALGKKAEARPFAEAALSWYQEQSWNPRQQASGMTSIALARALAGHEREALRSVDEGLKRLQSDKYSLEAGLFRAAQVYVVLDRLDDAVAALRELMKGPTYNTTADIVRLEPMFVRLKDDPRFEEILKSAKPL